eukprot:s880_g18.t1
MVLKWDKAHGAAETGGQKTCGTDTSPPCSRLFSFQRITVFYPPTLKAFEVWRLWTHTLLHSDLGHLAVNLLHILNTLDLEGPPGRCRCGHPRWVAAGVRMEQPQERVNGQEISGLSRTLVRPEAAWSKGLDGEAEETLLSDEGGSRSKDDDPCAEGIAQYFRTSLTAMLLGTDDQPALLNVLLVSIPLAFMSRFCDWGEAWVFLSALVGLIPLAERISFVTEDVAKYTNQTLGGLLNATFGNITELVVCIFAIRAGLFRVVQLSMLGSVLSNLLLVLGSAFLIGGCRHKEQNFNRSAAVTNTGLLIFAVLALSLPSILDETHSGAGGVAAPVSWLGQIQLRRIMVKERELW